MEKEKKKKKKRVGRKLQSEVEGKKGKEKKEGKSTATGRHFPLYQLNQICPMNTGKSQWKNDKSWTPG